MKPCPTCGHKSREVPWRDRTWAPPPDPERAELGFEHGGFNWLAVAERKRHHQKGEYVACWIEVGGGEGKLDRKDYFHDSRSTTDLVWVYVEEKKAEPEETRKTDDPQ